MVSTGKTMTKRFTLPIVAGFALAAKGANDARKVTAQTEAVIKSMGSAGWISAKQVDALATSLEKKTAVDADVIKNGQNLLLTFANIRNEVGEGNDVFDRATKIMVDMSVALGQDMKSGAIQLGKALDDPIKGITALRRVGVSFTQQEQDQIKALAEHGKTLQAQTMILDALDKQFKGSAEAQATAGGKMIAKLRELGDSFGMILLPIIDKVASAFQRLFNWFDGMSEGTKKVVVGVLAIVAVAGPLLIVAGKLVTAFAALKVALFGAAAAQAAVVATGAKTAGIVAGGGAAAAAAARSTTGAAAATGGLAGMLAKIPGPAKIAALAIAGIALGVRQFNKDAIKGEAVEQFLEFEKIWASFRRGEVSIERLRGEFRLLNRRIVEAGGKAQSLEAFMGFRLGKSIQGTGAEVATLQKRLRQNNIILSDAAQKTLEFFIRTGNLKSAIGVLKTALAPLSEGLKNIAGSYRTLTQQVAEAVARMKEFAAALAATTAKAAAAVSTMARGRMQHGGPVLQSGMYMVGEKGPEIVHLPAGAWVSPNEVAAGFMPNVSKLLGGGDTQGAVVTASSVEVNFGDVTISSDVGLAKFERSVERAVRRGAAKRGVL